MVCEYMDRLAFESCISRYAHQAFGPWQASLSLWPLASRVTIIPIIPRYWTVKTWLPSITGTPWVVTIRSELIQECLSVHVFITSYVVADLVLHLVQSYQYLQETLVWGLYSQVQVHQLVQNSLGVLQQCMKKLQAEYYQTIFCQTKQIHIQSHLRAVH